MYPDIDQNDDEESVTAWLENMQIDHVTETALHHNTDTELYVDTTSIHENKYTIEDKEADRILDYMENIMRDENNYDDDLIESIIESQKHQDEISKYRREKKARSIIQEWRGFAESQSSRRQFLFDVIKDLRYHHLISNTFQPWKDLMLQKRSIVEELIGQQKRKIMCRVFCTWTNQMRFEVQTIKVCQGLVRR